MDGVLVYRVCGTRMGSEMKCCITECGVPGWGLRLSVVFQSVEMKKQMIEYINWESVDGVD